MGKSSLIADMANYLNFDLYDLELTEIKKNSDLRGLLLATANNTILVVEDIDCTIDLQDKLGNREADDDSPSTKDKEGNKITLSGLLNFIDGLWSSCGDQRIIIFTTNHIKNWTLHCCDQVEWTCTFTWHNVLLVASSFLLLITSVV